jgi:ribosomal protein L30E
MKVEGRPLDTENSRALRNGKAKLTLLSSDTPPLRKSEIEYYAMLAGVRTTTRAQNNDLERPVVNTSEV